MNLLNVSAGIMSTNFLMEIADHRVKSKALGTRIYFFGHDEAKVWMCNATIEEWKMKTNNII